MKWLTKLFGRKSQPVIRFLSFLSDFSLQTPVVAAKSYRASWMKKQAKVNMDKRFLRCPGMMEYSQMGFLICAHTDIHIKADDVGVSITLGHLPVMSQEEASQLNPAKFDYEMVRGMAPISDAVVKEAWKVPLPWSIQADDGYSLYILPALMHSEFFDKLWVYPGIVDYDNYHTCNFVFSPLKECEITIPAGTPLMHALPFKREAFHGVSRKATEHERDKQFAGFPSRRPGAYLRFFRQPKQTTMDAPKCPFH